MNWHVLSLACLGPTYLMAGLLAAVWNWEAFYLICFSVGLLLAIISFLTGVMSLHLPGSFHMDGSGADASGIHAGGVHAGGMHAGGADASGANVGHMASETGQQVTTAIARAHSASFFNSFSIMAFLAWFGGTGYLLTRTHSLVAVVIFVIAGLAGIVGALVVFLFLARVLMAHEKPLDPADYDMIGVLGRVNTKIRPGGTGEIIFELAGTRRSAAARAEDQSGIPKGTEVVVTRYEHGIAYVRTWEEMTGEERWTAGANDSRQ